MSTVIDGTNAVLGRLASHAAKQLLAGDSIAIVNAERIIITGNRQQLQQKYLERRRRGSPQHGPFFPTQPHGIVKRTVRGMLPYKTHRGREAFKRLRVYTAVPATLKDADMERVAVREIRTRFVSVGDLAESLGWRR